MDTPTATAFRAAFCAVTREARLATGWTQEQMATALGIPVARYGKYETRSPMPHEMLPRFAQITRQKVDHMFAVATARALHRRAA